MTKHSYKFALTVAGALVLAAPLAVTPAAADQRHNGHDNGHMGGGHVDMYHDHSHSPPMRAERRPPMPHGGHYRWRAGNWGWRNGAWAWQPGIYIRL
jgi:hypothetical protein